MPPCSDYGLRMVSAPSNSVLLECVGVRKLIRGGEHDCSVPCCAWKVSRFLTRSIASTAQPQWVLHDAIQWRMEPVVRCRLRNEVHSIQNGGFIEAQYFSPLNDFGKSNASFHSKKRKKLCCSSSFSSDFYGAVSHESLWEDLKPDFLYLPSDELELVYKALKLAFEAHDGQKRRSGEPFIIHPVEVARILGKLELDWESIAAGLLHDTVEDTAVVTFESIEKKFGATVRRIVEGETKVSKLGKLQCKGANNSVQDVKADDLRQMFLAMTEEVRVIVVKLADRLHNMQTLSHMPQHKQTSISMETLEVFAPLAKLLGIYQIKSELENLSFMYTNSHDFSKIKKRMEDLSKEHKKELEEAKKILMQKIEDDQFLHLMTMKTEVHSVCKEPYSIYKAMIKFKYSINEINQVAQLRIIIKPKKCIGEGPLCNAQQICYYVLGLVHCIWTPIPRAMKDFIATPKSNGYQSLHTTVIPFLYESMFKLEVQIRTEEMDLIAERGIAAHYSGRGMVPALVGESIPTGRNLRGKSVFLNNTDIALRIGWLNAIREWQEEFVGNMSSREFVDTITRDLLGSRVFVFTPKGEIRNLPRGATVIDYAYMIHTEIGNKMVAAKVNGNLVSPMHVIENAEVVEIITYNVLSSKTAFHRHEQWLQHAKTRSARHKIMKFLREQAALSAIEITADTVDNFVADLDNDDEEIPGPSEKRSIWKRLIMNVVDSPSTKSFDGSILQVQNKIGTPKINGKYNKNVEKMSLKMNGKVIPELVHSNFPTYKDVLPGLESWKDSRIASWHNIEGHSIQWFCVICIDKNGMLAEVTSALTDTGVEICSCVAEIDTRKGMGVMLFQIEGTSVRNLKNASSTVDLISGVLGWSAGCSRSNSSDDAMDFLKWFQLLPKQVRMMGLRVVLEVQTNKTHHILSKSSMINNKPASQRSSRIHRRSNSDNAFLDECYLCRRNLLHHQDIYMCRDKAFCSERCRFKLLMIEDSRRR